MTLLFIEFWGMGMVSSDRIEVSPVGLVRFDAANWQCKATPIKTSLRRTTGDKK